MNRHPIACSGRCWPFMILAMGSLAASLSAAEKAPQPVDPHRVLLLAPSGPILVNIRLETGSQSIRQVRDAFCDSLFQQIDADNSGHLEASEQALLPMFNRGGGTAASFAVEDLMTADGLKKYIDNQLGPLFSIETKAPRLDQSVRLDLLDRDGDGVLTVDELTHAPHVLSRYDLDDDESLSVAELQPFPRSVRDARRQQDVEQGRGSRVMLLGESPAIDAALAAITRVYALESGLEVTRCGLKKLAAPFDQNADGKLDGSELKRWLIEGPPDIELSAQWRQAGSGRLPMMRVDVEPSDRIVPAKTTTRKWAAAIDAVPIEVGLFDNRVFAGESVKLLKTTRFSTSDRDKNQYLDESEFATLGSSAPFAAVDQNHDKMVTIPEIDAFFTKTSQLSQTRVVMTFSDDVVSLYQLMDADRSNRLSSRELTTLKERIAPFDRNGDDRFDSGDFVSVYKLDLAFSIPEGMEFTPTAMAMTNSTGGVRPTLRVGPLWYQRMDRNRDGDISWREFLGPRAKFDVIDTDHDDLISRDEAEAVEGPAGGATADQ